ncbi:hypothetical protein [Micromonospora sp. NPDC006431]|uniref:hypothetical protein n=1 Tax=Micromonospora sp. NPDC006431 TaxID=3364235 RepID=UPI0036B62325
MKLIGLDLNDAISVAASSVTWNLSWRARSRLGPYFSRICFPIDSEGEDLARLNTYCAQFVAEIISVHAPERRADAGAIERSAGGLRRRERVLQPG